MLVTASSAWSVGSFLCPWRESMRTPAAAPLVLDCSVGASEDLPSVRSQEYDSFSQKFSIIWSVTNHWPKPFVVSLFCGPGSWKKDAYFGVVLLILYGWIEETKSKALKCLLYVLILVELVYTPYHIKTTMENSAITCAEFSVKQPEPHLITED